MGPTIAPPEAPATSPLRRVLNTVGIGSIVGAAVAGGLMWIPTHKFGDVTSASLITLGLLTGLRLVDPYLTPLWRVLDRIPRLIRLAAGLGGSVWYSISQFGPEAAGREVSVLRRTLLVTVVFGYVILHPRARET